MHNHPTENPPTGSDFASLGYHGYHSGVVVCHNGKVYWYKVGDKPFTRGEMDRRIEKYKQSVCGYTNEEVYERVLNEFKEEYGVEWREIV